MNTTSPDTGFGSMSTSRLVNLVPDLTRHATQTCVSNTNWICEVKSRSGSTYMVRYEFRERGPHQFDYTCTCLAFKFGKGKRCKHIESVSANRCGWNGTLDIVEHVDECPDCGGPVESLEVAV